MIRENLIRNSIHDWSQAIELFARTTNLTASLYLASGQRVCGPFGQTPLSKFLQSSGKFVDGQIAQYTEQRELIKAVSTSKKVTFTFSQSIRIDAIPIIIREKVIGVVMLGWVFDHFPDPIECDRIAKDLGLPSNQMWQIARLHAPVSQDKLEAFEDMLLLLLTTLSQQLIAFQKVKEASRVKDELLAIVSHELKTPLTSLLLRIQMLQSHRVDQERMDDFLKSMEVNARMESKLIDDLLDAARMISGKYHFEPKLIDLQKTVAGALDIVTDTAREKEIKIVMTGPEKPTPFYGDPVRLTQAILNLINNSIKFTPHGGVIEIALLSNISNYEIHISDNGQGIDKTFMPQMFNIFSQPPKSTGNINSGLGLGLALVKNIIDLHRGKIEVQSFGENQGTKFEIKLPKDEFLND